MSDVPRRLLRETLRRRMSPAPVSGCIDTETLAAWSDGALSARERQAAASKDRTADLKDAVTPKRLARADEQRAAAAGAAQPLLTPQAEASGAASRAGDRAAAAPRPSAAPSAADASPEITAEQAAPN